MMPSLLEPATASIASFALTSVLIELTPGPNMAYLAVLAATHGRRPGLAAVFGVSLGLAIVGTAAAFGLAALVTGSPAAFALLRWAGALYLLYLAVDAWREANGTIEGLPARPEPDFVYFGRGLLTNLLNPKAAAFYIAVLPRFVDPVAPVLGQTMLLTVVYVGVATAIHAGIVIAAGSAASLLGDAGRARRIRKALAAALGLIALWFLWTSR